MVRLARARAEALTGKPLYTFLEGGEEPGAALTYAELDAAARSLAALLREEVSAGERALLLYPPGLDFVAAFFGCLYAGVVAVPVYPPASARHLPRLAAVAEDSRPALVLTTAGKLASHVRLLEPAPEFEGVRFLALDLAAARSRPAPPDPPADPRPQDLALLQYTSGSTSAPKGVKVTHANLLHNEEMICRAFEHSEETVVVGWLPLYHDMGLIGNVLQPLYCGGTCALFSPMDFLRRPLRWLEAISRFRATTAGGPDFGYALCTAKVVPEDLDGLDLSSWRVAFNGAEPVRAGTLERFAERFGPCGFRREAFYPCYGLAEATLLVSGGRARREPTVLEVSAPALARGRAAPVARGGATQVLVGCGGPWDGQTVRIVDPESGKSRREGLVGEIWVAGPSVTAGYFGPSGRGSEAFGAALPGEQGPYLRTGDLGFVEAGELFVTGRIKDLIILRGRNLYPQDLEISAERAHPALRRGCAAAFSVETPAGERAETGGGERVVVVQEIERRREAEAPEAAAAIRRAVAEEHDAAAEVVVVRAGSVPRTSSGKVRRAHCRQLFLRGELHLLAGGPGEEECPEEAVAGAAESAEETVAALAAEALQLPAERLPRDRPLTAQGLDSVAAIQLLHGLEQRFGAAPPLEDLLLGPSVAELAKAVSGKPAVAADGEPALAPGEEPEQGRDLPLSEGQKALYFLVKLAPEATSYHLAVAARAEGLDLDALRAALAALARRHAMLRSTFHERGSTVWRRVASAEEAPPLGLEVEEAPAGEAAVRERLGRLAAEPFDLERGPLLRLAVLRSEGAAYLLLAAHHIAADFWSLARLAEELGALHAARGRLPEEAAALPRASYADWVNWQRRALEGVRAEARAAFWRRLLDGVPMVLELPTDRPWTAAPGLSGGRLSRRLAPRCGPALAALARRADTTPFTVVLAAYQCLLARTTGRRKLVVGAPSAGRSPAGVEGVVGYFVNALALPADLSDDPSAASLLVRTRETVRNAQAHGDYPFPRLAEALHPERAAGRSPVFQTMAAHQRAPGRRGLAAFALELEGARLELGDLRLECLTLGERGIPFELALFTAELEDGALGAGFDYSSGLFDETTVRRMLRHLETLLLAFEATPELPVSRLDLLAPPEKQQLFSEWAASGWGEQRGGLLPDAVETWAERTPEAPVLEIEQGGAEAPEGGWRVVSYAALAARAAVLAGRLRGSGVGPEVVVAVGGERASEVLVGLLGVLGAGGVFLPLDTSLPAARRAFLLRDSGARLLLADEAFHARLEAEDLPLPRERVCCLEALAPEGDHLGWSPRPEPGQGPSADPDNLAYLIYTSGTTGEPKAVGVSHAQLLPLLRWSVPRLGMGPWTKVLQTVSYSFDFGIYEFLVTLLAGGCLAFPQPQRRGDPLHVVESLAARSVETLHATPSFFERLAATGRSLRSLRMLFLGGEALSRDLVERMGSLLDSDCRLFNAYGPTEAAVSCSTFGTLFPARSGEARRRVRGSVVPLGRPSAADSLYVADRRLRLVPQGSHGEALIGGEGVARGYFGRPALTASRFLPDPFGRRPGSRLYKTGDLVRHGPAGDLEFLGRLDHQVKIRGHRVETGEIEACLLRHRAVREAVVLARAAAGRPARLVAYVVPAGGSPPNAADLRRHARDRLPEYMVPSAFEVLAAFPSTRSGKVDLRALPEPGGGEEPRGVSHPRGELEARIAALWAELLGLEAAPVDESFFDLGGHSLLLTEVQARLRRDLGFEVPLVELFEHPTVRSLARHLGGEPAGLPTRPVAPPVVRASRERGIAVIGFAGRFPGAPSAETLWANVCAGVESIRFYSEEEMRRAGADEQILADPRWVRAGGELEGFDRFDAALFGVSPEEAEILDPQHRQFLECAHAALEHAGYDPRREPGRVGVFAASGLATYLLNLASRPDLVRRAGTFEVGLANDKDFLPTRVSYKLDLHGPSCTVQTACSSSLVAVHAACRSLAEGEAEMALAGGVSINMNRPPGYLYQRDLVFSPDGRCRAFDHRAAGTVRGSGVGAVVLKPLESALEDGDTVHAVIRGSAVNNDGARKVGFTAPSVEGQAAVISQALATAGVDPASIGYVEAHGTGTPLGDPIEVAALRRAFGSGAGRGGCALGSVKPNIGHLDAASGVAGLIKAVMAVGSGVIPPLLHLETPNPALEIERSPFRLPAEADTWRQQGPRRAGVSSFGIGGTNAHAVLEEAPAQPVTPSARSRHLVVLSAASATALETLSRRLARHLRAHPDLEIADVAHTLQVGRRRLPYRRFLEAGRAEEAAALLEAPAGPGVATVHATAEERPLVFFSSGGDPAPRALADGGTLGSAWRALGVEPQAVAGEGVGEVAEAMRDPTAVLLVLGGAGAAEALGAALPGRLVLCGGEASLWTLGRLWAAGAEVDWRTFHGAERRRRLPLPSYPFEGDRYFVEAAVDGGFYSPQRTARRPSEPVSPAPAAAPAAAGAALRPRPSLATPFRAPEGPAEEHLGALWQELLGVEGIGAWDGFFDLGGDSLQAVRLLGRVEEAFGKELSLRELFAHPTIADLARVLGAASGPGASGLGGEEGAIPPREEPAAEPVLLSFAQRRLWFLDRLDPGVPLYHQSCAARLLGPLEATALRRSLEVIVSRHEALRTVFSAEPAADGEPRQLVLPAARLAFPAVDLSGLPAAARQAEALRLGMAELRLPFDVVTGPPLRSFLLRLAGDEHALLLTLHHMVSDGWSMEVLLAELTDLYPRGGDAGEGALAGLSVQYADFALWQRRWLEGARFAEQLAYWRQRLAGLEPLELPTDRPRPAAGSARGAQLPVHLPAAAVEPLEVLARRRGTTLYAVLLTGLQALLARSSGQRDLAVGTPVANRRRPEVEPLIGFFANTLVLRGELAGDPPFADLVERTAETVLGALASQDLPFEKLVEEISPRRDLARNPFFDVLLLLQHAAPEAAPVGDLTLVPWQLDPGTSKFDLSFFLWREAGGLRGFAEYAADLFDPTTAARFGGQLSRLLAAAGKNPELPLSRLPLLGRGELHQLLVETQGPHPREPAAGLCLHHGVRRWAAREPERPAVEGLGEALTYGELAERARALAAVLSGLGAGPEVPVGLLLPRSAAQMVGLLAILEAGAAVVPLEAGYPDARLRELVDEADLALLVTRTDLRDRLAAAGAAPEATVCLDAPPAESAQTAPLAVPGGEARAENLAYVLFTSGSTGRPKGVAMPHGALTGLLEWQTTELPDAARTLQLAPLSFDVSFQEIFSTWTQGGTLVLVAEEVRRDPAALWRYLVRERIERLYLPFVALRQLAEAAGASAERPPLGDVVSAGEQLQVTPAVEALFEALPAARLHNHYGPTETHVITAHTLGPRASHRSDGQPSIALPPIGLPVAGCRVRVLGPRLETRPLGAEGELCLGGAGLARGYFRRPGRTAASFVPDPWGDGERLYRSGDLGRLRAGGELEHAGRLDAQAKVRGFRVEPGEVEAALVAHPGVGQAAVVARPDAAGEARLVAYLVARGPALDPRLDRDRPEPAALRSFLAATLPEHAVPARWVWLEALPLTATGKLSRRCLPAPDDEALARPAGPFEAPHTAAESLLAGIWEEVLEVSRVGVGDDFFALGGHSLMAARVASRVREATGVELALRDLFRAPTLGALAAALDEATLAGAADETMEELLAELEEGG